MDENDNENEDWVEGGTLEASASNLTFFGGACVQIDTSYLPDPPEPNVA
jgi:hypothetical protein